MLDATAPRIFETSFIGVRYLAAKRSPAVEHFATPNEANAWAAQQSEQLVRIFAWDEKITEGFNGFAVEEQRFLRGEYGQRSRVWHMPADVAAPHGPEPASAGKPTEAPRASVTATHYEIGVILKGHLGPIRERADTLSQAQEAAADKCRALGFAEYFELTKDEKIEHQKSDSVYLCVIESTNYAVAI